MSEPSPPDQPAAAASASRRIPGHARGVAALTVAVFVVAAIIYAVIPKSPGGQAPVRISPAAERAAGNRAAAGNSLVEGAGQSPAPQPGAATAGPAGQNPQPAPTSPKPLKPTSPAKIKAWNIGSGGAALALVTTQSGNALMAHSAGQYPEMLGYCTALVSAVRGAEKVTPIPDAAMERMYLKSLSAFKQGATECVRSITQHPEGVEDTVTNVDYAVLDRAVSELNLGIRDLYIATEALRKQ